MSRHISSGFDRLAPYYDTLARWVFGDDIKRAQTVFLNSIPPSSKVLIIGGGTGWILHEVIGAVRDVTVWYVDVSPVMIRKARQYNFSEESVEFIVGTIDDVPAEKMFDVVITPFYLDLFSEVALLEVIKNIRQRLKPAAHWLVTDFIPSGRVWHRFLLWVMYRFFRVVCGIEARSLPRWQHKLEEAGLVKVKEQRFHRGFICSVMVTESNANP